MNRKERRSIGERGPKYPTVELAYIHPGDVSAAFMASAFRCRDYELMRTNNLFGFRERRSRSGSIYKARNEITTMFVRGSTEWLWFVDADMGFPKSALHQLIATADPVERPVMGALCFAHRTEGYDEETNADLFGMIPTVSVWDRDEADQIIGFKNVVDYPRDAVCKVDASGAACVLIHRSVLKRVQVEYGENWWTPITHPIRPNERFGEDTSFFLRLTELGVPVHVNTGVRTSHDKGGIFLTEAAWDAQERARTSATEAA